MLWKIAAIKCPWIRQLFPSVPLRRSLIYFRLFPLFFWIDSAAMQQWKPKNVDARLLVAQTEYVFVSLDFPILWVLSPYSMLAIKELLEWEKYLWLRVLCGAAGFHFENFKEYLCFSPTIVAEPRLQAKTPDKRLDLQMTSAITEAETSAHRSLMTFALKSISIITLVSSHSRTCPLIQSKGFHEW